MKSIFFIITFLLSFSVFSQGEEYVSANGIIKNIEMKRSGRTVKEIATVSFSIEQGETIETYVELDRIPFFGSFKSVGDEITINYNKNNPAIAQTNMGNFLSNYGMYILVFLGIVFSFRTYAKARKNKHN
jgi:hypothetical protein